MNLENDKTTALYDEHLKLNAKMLPYAGYEMPISYSKGIKSEYEAIRNQVGAFDVSHMGEIKIFGKESFDLLQLITSNDISKLNNGDAQYSLICNSKGGIKDDIIIYKISKTVYLLIVNASNCLKIFNWIKQNNKFDAKVINETEKLSLIAVQGPKSRSLLNNIFNKKINLKFYTHEHIKYNNKKLLISRTGYTGELGFEILLDNNLVIPLWQEIIKKGAAPCGLAVRDVLRMEMKYCLYGNDINEDITPLEAGLNWVISLNNNFIGQKYILKQKKNGVKKKLIPFILKDRGIPRKGYEIFDEENVIGEVTSGTFSIGLNHGIGIGYIDRRHKKSDIFIGIRDKKCLAKIIQAPFIEKYSLHN